MGLSVVSESVGSHHKEPVKWNLSTPSNSNRYIPSETESTLSSRTELFPSSSRIYSVDLNDSSDNDNPSLLATLPSTSSTAIKSSMKPKSKLSYIRTNSDTVKTFTEFSLQYYKLIEFNINQSSKISYQDLKSQTPDQISVIERKLFSLFQLLFILTLN